MPTLRDQRHMSGLAYRATPEEVVGFWQQHADDREERGLPRYPEAPARRELHRSKARVAAYVSDGRWVAACRGGPNGTCNGGIACWPDHEIGCCLDCGTVYPVEFPHRDTIEDAERVLALRPTEHRNWRPHEGETPDELAAENLQHGYRPRGGPSEARQLADASGLSEKTVERVLRAQRGE